MFYFLYLADDQTKLMRLNAEFVASNKDLYAVTTAPESLNPTDAAEVTETASVEKANQKVSM